MVRHPLVFYQAVLALYLLQELWICNVGQILEGYVGVTFNNNSCTYGRAEILSVDPLWIRLISHTRFSLAYPDPVAVALQRP